MTIKVCKLTFKAELAVNDEMSGAEVAELHKALERTVAQHGVYSRFMIGKNTLVITEKYDECTSV